MAKPLAALDLIGAEQRLVDAPDERGHGVGRIETLIRIGLTRKIGVGGDLPPAHVDRLQSGAHHLHGLTSRQRA